VRIVVLGVLAILVLGAGGAGAYFYFGKQAVAAIGDTPDHQEAKETQARKDGHGSQGGKFVELDPLVLPIIDERGVTQIVSIVVVIEVDSADKVKEVERLAPRLKDAYIQDMYGVLNKHAALKGGVVQVGEIKERLNRISDRVLGEDIANDVLLQVVQQRPI
jgi:flagellar protein FliL